MKQPATERLCDVCNYVGPLEPERCTQCGGPTWTIYEAQRAIARAMVNMRPQGYRLERCRRCDVFNLRAPDEGPTQCVECVRPYEPHPAHAN